MADLESEDVLFESLQTLYDYHPITLTTPGKPFTYVAKSQHGEASRNNDRAAKPVTIDLETPDTHSANWALHASSIWVASIFLADHIERLGLDTQFGSLIAPPQERQQQQNRQPGNKLRVLELGASAGLPSILIAKLHPHHVNVTTTDYPDEQLIKTLKMNVERNGVAKNCRAVAYAWGTDPTSVLEQQDTTSRVTTANGPTGSADTSMMMAEGVSAAGDGDIPEGGSYVSAVGHDGFDVIIAADTIWNPDFHPILVDSLRKTLKRTAGARAHLVAGMHTGRYTIRAFLDAVRESGFEMEQASEHHVSKDLVREWVVEREGEDEMERRSWVIWITLKWRDLFHCKQVRQFRYLLSDVMCV